MEINSNDKLEAKIWFTKGTNLFHLRKYEEAIVCYDKALEFNPNYAYAWNSKGNALAKLRKSEEAKVCFDKARNI